MLVTFPASPKYELILPLLGAQFATVAGWFILGDGAMLTRLPLILAAIALNEPVQILCGEPVQPGMPTAAAIGYLLGIAAPLFVLRFCGWMCQSPQHPQKRDRPLRAQFSIRQLLVGTLVIALLLGLLRITPMPHINVAAFAAMWGLAVGVVPCSQWIVTLRPNLSQGIPVGFGILVAAWIVGSGMVEGDVEATLVWLGITLLHTLVLSINLVILRWRGYRLVRQLP